MDLVYDPTNEERLGITDSLWISCYVSCYGAPLQIEGVIGNTRFYYRERHGNWRIEYPRRSAYGKSDPEHDECMSLALSRIMEGYLSLTSEERQ
jgi:hypothetical protein